MPTLVVGTEDGLLTVGDGLDREPYDPDGSSESRQRAQALPVSPPPIDRLRLGKGWLAMHLQESPDLGIVLFDAATPCGKRMPPLEIASRFGVRSLSPAIRPK